MIECVPWLQHHSESIFLWHPACSSIQRNGKSNFILLWSPVIFKEDWQFLGTFERHWKKGQNKNEREEMPSFLARIQCAGITIASCMKPETAKVIQHVFWILPLSMWWFFAQRRHFYIIQKLQTSDFEECKYFDVLESPKQKKRYMQFSVILSRCIAERSWKLA